jgi:putative ATPase
MDLFDHSLNERVVKEAPLAARMRPRTLDEFIGQEHIVGPGRLLRRAIQADQLSSIILYGPPGVGKTTLAMVVANTTRSHFITINAVLAGVADIREAIKEARERRGMYNQRTILFVDEVHRWNKAQQDALLPWVENGTIILIGATTENPFFSVNRPLVSRSRVFQLRALDQNDLRRIVRAALADEERGYGRLNVELKEDALEHLVNVANGDARSVLNALELAVETTPPNEEGAIVVDMMVAEESIQRRAVLYDKEGDVHFDTISAFIKSLRGSDPDAAMYWLAKMVYAGEDPDFLFRRMLILAGEDVGLADPQAIAVVTACFAAFDRVGLPEGRFQLAEAALYLATAPKSNSAFAFFDALNTVESERESDVPSHLKDASRDKEGFGHGEGYLYPHAYRDHWVAQQYLPDALQGKVFYQPSDQGYERSILEQVTRRREAQLAAMVEDVSPHPTEVLTFSRRDRDQDRWLQRTVSEVAGQLSELRDHVLNAVALRRHDVVLDLNAGSGLLTWEALRRTPEGSVWSLTPDSMAGEALRQQAARLSEVEQPVVLVGSVPDLPALLEVQGGSNVRFDAIVGRNALGPLDPVKRQGAVEVLVRLLSAAGKISLIEVVPHHSQRLYALVDLSPLGDDLAGRVKAAEEAIYADPNDPMVNWDAPDLGAAFEQAGLGQVAVALHVHRARTQIGATRLARWFANAEAETADGSRPSYAAHLLHHVSGAELAAVRALFERVLLNQTVTWETKQAHILASRDLAPNLSAEKDESQDVPLSS